MGWAGEFYLDREPQPRHLSGWCAVALHDRITTSMLVSAVCDRWHDPIPIDGTKIRYVDTKNSDADIDNLVKCSEEACAENVNEL